MNPISTLAFKGAITRRIRQNMFVGGELVLERIIVCLDTIVHEQCFMFVVHLHMLFCKICCNTVTLC